MERRREPRKGGLMGKYLVIASYTPDGAQGLLKDGGSARRKAIKSLATSVGGKLESFYFAFGSDDAFVTLDIPDAASAAALGLAVREIFAPDIKWHTGGRNPLSGDLKGVDEVFANFGKLFELTGGTFKLE